MPNVYVQFKDDSETVVCSVYAGPQDVRFHPNQATLDSTDLRYQAFINPPPPPLTCTPFQFRAALSELGLRSQVDSAIAASSNQSVKDAYSYAQVFIEDDAFIQQMASQLGQTKDQVHALFLLAQTLRA